VTICFLHFFKSLKKVCKSHLEVMGRALDAYKMEWKKVCSSSKKWNKLINK
jgi:hypothetical protein